MDLRSEIGLLYKTSRNRFYKPNPDALLLLGFNKSGTSVTINLIAHRAGLSFIDDPMYKLSGFDEVLEGKISLQNYLYKHSYFFSKQLIRYPVEPEAVQLATDFFRMEKYILTIRNPVENIKSILARLNIPGHLDYLDTKNLPVHRDWKKMLTVRDHYIKSLAQCWKDAYSQEDFLNNKSCVLFKYEDFKSDKEEYITEKVIQLGFQPKYSIHDLVNIQYQPKGTSKSNIDFFGRENLNLIIKSTGDLASKFGYN